ncbi:YgaP family membrane protein [Micromonospora echinofusca]|uniref:Uncharacterized protein n=1 Tax=Micromonospora echinofusca TaxID=47858 RepID=A0ABS3VQE3_MICEH|nr:DUF2892 domain-containing protein [Micromonospora echinofusca]MBO4206735.1 hypothetical protein [Micromonospora echinofusca]
MRRRWAPLLETLVKMLVGVAAIVLATTWLTAEWAVVVGLVGCALLVTGLVRLPRELRYARGVVRVTRPSTSRPPTGGGRRRAPQQRHHPTHSGPTGAVGVGTAGRDHSTGQYWSDDDRNRSGGGGDGGSGSGSDGSSGGWSDSGSGGWSGGSSGGSSDSGGGYSGGGDSGGGGW